MLSCITIFLFSGYQIVKIYDDYNRAESIINDLEVYKPLDKNIATKDNLNENNSLVELSYNYSDVRGWIELDGTKIDYMVVQASDNSKYLRKSIDNRYTIAGMLFMDYRCPKELEFNTIIYGHNMKNGTMFADIEKYADFDYFETHQEGTFYYLDQVYELEVIAYMKVSSTDGVIYNTSIEKEEFLNELRSKSVHQNDFEFDDIQKVLTLSTCTNETDDERYILVVNLATE